MHSQTISNWQGALDLAFVRRQEQTVMARSLAQAPLKVQRPFYPEGEKVCHAVMLHTAGGVVGGDRLAVDISLAANAQALITTAAASKIYRTNGQLAQQTAQIQVESGACLEWLPQETIVFNGAIYRQELRVELAPGASWLGWEIVRFGRTARGEQFLQGSWQSDTEIWQQGIPLWIDRQYLPGDAEVIASPHGLNGQPIVASLSWVGQAVSPELVSQARSLWQQQQQTSPSSGEAGVTRLQRGLLCRYRGASTSEVRSWFIAVWQLLRLSFLDRPGCHPRVWPL